MWLKAKHFFYWRCLARTTEKSSEEGVDTFQKYHKGELPKSEPQLGASPKSEPRRSGKF